MPMPDVEVRVNLRGVQEARAIWAQVGQALTQAGQAGAVMGTTLDQGGQVSTKSLTAARVSVLGFNAALVNAERVAILFGASNKELRGQLTALLVTMDVARGSVALLRAIKASDILTTNLLARAHDLLALSMARMQAAGGLVGVVLLAVGVIVL